MATKASQSPRFQPKPTTWELVESAEFASAKLPKKHITHESNAQLSTSGSLQFSFGNSQIVEGGGFAHTEAPKSTSITKLMPICLHQPFDCSPLVSFKWLEEADLHCRSLIRGTLSTNLMPICLHPDLSGSPLVSSKWLREWDLHTTKLR